MDNSLPAVRDINHIYIVCCFVQVCNILKLCEMRGYALDENTGLKRESGRTQTWTCKVTELYKRGKISHKEIGRLVMD